MGVVLVAPPRTIPILNYHSVSETPGPEIASFTVRPTELASHLDQVMSSGLVPLTVSALVGLLDSGGVPPQGAVVITFDDGFEDNLAVAAPMLASRGLPATVFVTTGYLPGCPVAGLIPAPGPMIPYDRLTELETFGIEVGSHAHSHRQLDVLPKDEAGTEIRLGKELLERALGHPVASFAYPHGYAGRSLQREVRRSGFSSACGVRNAFSHVDDNKWLLARLTVLDSTTHAQVAEWLDGAGAPIASRHEHLRTKAWRMTRRLRASKPSSAVRQ